MAKRPLKTGSIAFEDVDGHESVSLFTTYEGDKLIDIAQEFCGKFNSKQKEMTSGEAMYKFCRYLENPYEVDNEFTEGMYLGTDEFDGYNSDYGHTVVSVLTGNISRQEKN
jgi:hypothetical protein